MQISYLICIFINTDENFRNMGNYKKANILKTKSNFTLLIYIPYLGIGEWYFKCD